MKSLDIMFVKKYKKTEELVEKYKKILEKEIKSKEEKEAYRLAFEIALKDETLSFIGKNTYENEDEYFAYRILTKHIRESI